jgi:GT2 family glycosyltransferase
MAQTHDSADRRPLTDGRTDGGPASSLPVSIVVPAFGAAPQLADCLESLSRHAPRGCEVLVADDATPDDSVVDVVRTFEAILPLRYARRSTNLGFVENCNEAIRSVLSSGNDVLLLNSDTQVTAGFLEEMWEVLHLHEKHAVVSPRSNNATIFSVPYWGGLTAEESYQLWRTIRHLFPRYQVMPTAVGFCLLIKNVVIRQLGVFDPIYSPGYHEENDFICRINRYGYSAVVAHHAFVFHHESASFGATKRNLERRNSQLLDERYPEYRRKVGQHMRYGVDPIDHFAILWKEHHKTILFDLFHLPAKHSGTSEFALSLLLRLAPLLDERYQLRLGLSDEARQFFSNELTGYQLYDPVRHTDARFDLVFKPSQIFTWPELLRMVRLGGRIAYTHLDVIAIRCDYLNGPNTRSLFKTAALLADRVMTISEFSRADFAALYDVSVPFEVIHPGTHEARGTGTAPRVQPSAGYVLIVGNQFHHKAVDRAICALRGVGELVALGGTDTTDPSVRSVPSGSLSRSAIAELFDEAAVVVYPSFYEGFGMPILDALAQGIPVVALSTAVNEELRSLVPSNGLFLVHEHDEMRSIVERILRQPAPSRVEEPVPRAVEGPPTVTASDEVPLLTWERVARQYALSFEDLLSRELDLDLIRRRWDLLTTIDAVHPFP